MANNDSSLITHITHASCRRIYLGLCSPTGLPSTGALPSSTRSPSEVVGIARLHLLHLRLVYLGVGRGLLPHQAVDDLQVRSDGPGVVGSECPSGGEWAGQADSEGQLQVPAISRKSPI